MARIDITRVKTYYPRLGKISVGAKATRTGEGGKVITFPIRTETLVFRSDDAVRLEAVARVLGGRVEPSPDPNQESKFRVITAAKEIEVVIPAADFRGWSAQHEFWGAGGKLRQCDGTICQFTIDPATGERQENTPCICAAHHLDDEDACKLTSRLNVLIPALEDVPGIGVWQVESRGVSTWMAIQGAFSLLNVMPGGIVGIPLTLRVEIRQKRTPKGVQKWPAITLISHESFLQARERAKRLPIRIQPELLPPPDTESPPLGAAMTPEERAAADAPDAPVLGPAGTGTAPTVRSDSTGVSRPTVHEFWTTIRRAAAVDGVDRIAWVARRANGISDLRQLDDATVTRIYAAARAIIVSTDARPASPLPAPLAPAPAARPEDHPDGQATSTMSNNQERLDAASPAQAAPSAPRRGKLKRDYTLFWQTVGAAAAREDDPSPQHWLARNHDGRADAKALTDEEFVGLLAVAKSVVDGRAQTKDPAPVLEPPEGTQPTSGSVATQTLAGQITSEQLDTIEREFRARGIHLHQRTELARWASGNRTTLLGHLRSDEADRLIRRLAEEISTPADQDALAR